MKRLSFLFTILVVMGALNAMKSGKTPKYPAWRRYPTQLRIRGVRPISQPTRRQPRQKMPSIPGEPEQIPGGVTQTIQTVPGQQIPGQPAQIMPSIPGEQEQIPGADVQVAVLGVTDPQLLHNLIQQALEPKNEKLAIDLFKDYGRFLTQDHINQLLKLGADKYYLEFLDAMRGDERSNFRLPLSSDLPEGAKVIDLIDMVTSMDEDRPLTPSQRKNYQRIRNNFGLDDETQRQIYGLDPLEEGPTATASTSKT